MIPNYYPWHSGPLYRSLCLILFSFNTDFDVRILALWGAFLSTEGWLCIYIRDLRQVISKSGRKERYYILFLLLNFSVVGTQYNLRQKQNDSLNAIMDIIPYGRLDFWYGPVDADGHCIKIPIILSKISFLNAPSAHTKCVFFRSFCANKIISEYSITSCGERALIANMEETEHDIQLPDSKIEKVEVDPATLTPTSPEVISR